MAAHERAKIERRYDVDDAATVPDLTAADGVSAVEDLEPITLEAVYFDTENLDLAARRVVLRRREGGPDEGWHLEEPAEEGRLELRWPLGRARRPVGTTGAAGTTGESATDAAVPGAVLEPVRAIIRDRAVLPLARIRTVRTRAHLRDERGEVVAELFDDAVSATDVRGGRARTWREWEVELLPAAPDTRKGRTRLLDAIERVLASAGAHPSSSCARIARALGADSLTDPLPAAGPGAGANPTEPGPGTAASVVVVAVRRLTAELENADPAVRANRPDAVHQMRRSVRRLRSVLASNRRLFDPEAVRALQGGLTWLGASLGVARDAEVRGKRAATELAAVPEHRSDPAALARLVDGAGREYARAHNRVRRRMSSPRYFRLLDSLDGFAAGPPLSPRASRPAAKEVGRTLRRDVRRLRRRAERAAAAAPADRDAALHDVRKAVRRLRNSVDAVRPEAALVFGPRRRRVLSRISAAATPIEKSLGDRHDLVLFAEQLEIAGT
ncbi:MAG: CYTH and CHAD domain-containing protein, partial [Cryobacterium sp.]